MIRIHHINHITLTHSTKLYQNRNEQQENKNQLKKKMMIIPNQKFPGDVIHLLGYYPPNPTTTERPRPNYKPVFTYPKPSKPTTTITSPSNTFSHPYDQLHHHHHHQNQQHHVHQQHQATAQRPTWEHETNQISSSPSFYPLVHPDEHFGMVDEDGFGSEAEAAVFSHNGYGDYSNKPTSYADDDYRPYQGIELI